jgi:hypothetical protein
MDASFVDHDIGVAKVPIIVPPEELMIGISDNERCARMYGEIAIRQKKNEKDCSRLGFVSRKWPQNLPFHKVSPNKTDRLDKINLLAKPKTCRHTN